MLSTPYDNLASEYYDPYHKTCRNFDATTVDALGGRQLLPQHGLILEVGCGRGRCSEFLQAPRERIVQLDASQAMLEIPDREPCLLRLHADATNIPTVAGEFTGVVGFLVDPFIGLDFLREAFRV